MPRQLIHFILHANDISEEADGFSGKSRIGALAWTRGRHDSEKFEVQHPFFANVNPGSNAPHAPGHGNADPSFRCTFELTASPKLCMLRKPNYFM